LEQNNHLCHDVRFREQSKHYKGLHFNKKVLKPGSAFSRLFALTLIVMAVTLQCWAQRPML